MVPFAMGQDVNFIKNKGPELSKFDLKLFFNNTEEKFSKKLSPIYKAIAITRKKLDKRKSLISFIGAPWTLLIYMFGLQKNKKEIELNNFKERDTKFNSILTFSFYIVSLKIFSLISL